MSDEMPFGDYVTQDRAESASDKQAEVKDPSLLIRRIAEVKDELERRGANALTIELDALKDRLKKLMLERKLENAVDEESGTVAEIQTRTKDSWDLPRLRRILTPVQRDRYLSAVDVKAIENGIKIGDLSLAELTLKKAVRRVPFSTALVFRSMAQAEDD